MRLSRIWRILQVEESVIHRGRRPRWITSSEICRILHILRKPVSIIALLFIQNIIFAQTCKLYSRPFLSLLRNTALCPGFLGQWFNNLWRQWFNNLQRAALLTSFWPQWFNNLQRTALLMSLVQCDRILGQQQLFMVNYACGFNQSETGKYFEWIIIEDITRWREDTYIICRLGGPFGEKLWPRAWKCCRTDLKPANNMFNFFPAVNWLYRLHMDLFTQLLSFSGLARRRPTICKKSWQRTSYSDSIQKKDVLKNRLFSNYFMLAVFIVLIQFSKIVFAVWNFVRSLSFTTKTISVRRCMLPKSIEWDISTLNWIAESEKVRFAYSREILLNTVTIREVKSTETDSNFTAKEIQDYAALKCQVTNNETNFQKKRLFKTFSYKKLRENFS